MDLAHFSLAEKTPDQLCVLIDFCEHILNAQTYDSVWKICTSFFKHHGIDAVNFGVFERASADFVGFSSNMKPDWIAHYSAQAHHLNDPIVDTVLVRQKPFLLGFGAPPSLIGNQNQQHVFDETQEAGYRNILTAPFAPAKSPYSYALVMANGLGKKEASGFLRSNGKMLDLAAAIATQRASELFLPGRATDSWIAARRVGLSPREREVVCWLAAGLQTDEIAHRLGLSHVTIHLHVSSAKQKLGARTRAHLVALAMLRKLI